jgi:type I restriction enzyme M protein
LDLIERESVADNQVKAAQKALDEQVFARYPQLSESEIKTLVVADKWQVTLQDALQAEIERVTQHLANRVKLLVERYAEPLHQIVDEVAELSSRVDAHLKRMGLIW